jgi:hypothetical protein
MEQYPPNKGEKNKKRKTEDKSGTGNKSKDQHLSIAENYTIMASVLDHFGNYLTEQMCRASFHSRGGSKQLEIPKAVPNRIYLHILLQAFVDSYKGAATATKRNLEQGYSHCLYQTDDDGRKDLPRYLKKVLVVWYKSDSCQIKEQCREWRGAFFKSADKDEEKIVDCRATLWWCVAYLGGLRPNTSLPGWEKFECSHCCLEKCLTLACLSWESKSVNQSRANPACAKQCHCPCTKSVCTANMAHNPSCK